jgi:hypothetical protein
MVLFFTPVQVIDVGVVGPSSLAIDFTFYIYIHRIDAGGHTESCLAVHMKAKLFLL